MQCMLCALSAHTVHATCSNMSMHICCICRLRHFEQQIEKSTRDYNMEKLTTLKTEVDDTSRKFEECQDAYATSMYEFISCEQQYSDKIQRVRLFMYIYYIRFVYISCLLHVHVMYYMYM